MMLPDTGAYTVMKALARYQIILLGEQRHIGVSNLPKYASIDGVGFLMTSYIQDGGHDVNQPAAR